MLNHTFLGLDLETSGTNIYAGAVPIQIGLGMVLENGDMLMTSELIGGWIFSNLDEYAVPDSLYDPSHRAYWNDESARIHNISPLAVKAAHRPDEVAMNMVNWINDRELPPPPKLHVVGWNVSTFDMPFVAQYMPGLEARLSYRVIELNSLAYALDGALKPASPDRWTFNSVKKKAKEHAERRLEVAFDNPMWHDAGYDALAAVHCYDFMKAAIDA